MGRQNDPRLKASDDGDAVLNPALALAPERVSACPFPKLEDAETARTSTNSSGCQCGGPSRPNRAGVSVATDGAVGVLVHEGVHVPGPSRERARHRGPPLGHGPRDPRSDNPRWSPPSTRIEPEREEHEGAAWGTPLVLDADSSQRSCVAAAVAGHSFVMDGPPGTGKSQTIANMIGALLHAGKTVLFVSEKAAALEVVRNRLAHVGLESYVLELHSQQGEPEGGRGAACIGSRLRAGAPHPHVVKGPRPRRRQAGATQ